MIVHVVRCRRRCRFLILGILDARGVFLLVKLGFIKPKIKTLRQLENIVNIFLGSAIETRPRITSLKSI